MIIKMPMYYKDFRCIADKCQDNCCIGWEIDIDASAAEYYKTVEGSFGNKLRSNISQCDTPSFILKGERCPFLNEKNLCEIIINLSESKLCQICRDHPRYFEWFADVKEGGIGLCCEEAARLIVTSKENFTTYETECDDIGCDDYNEALYDMLTFARNEIISTLENDNLPLKERIASVIAYTKEVQFLADNYCFDKIPIKESYPAEDSEADVNAFLRAFTDLEPIDDNWQNYLQCLIDSSETLRKNLNELKDSCDLYLKNIAVYFVWRYFLKGVYDEEIISKIMLMAVSIAMIKLMYLHKHLSLTALTDEICSITAKSYSKETEYSEENLEKIFDAVYDNPAFSDKNILSII